MNKIHLELIHNNVSTYDSGTYEYTITPPIKQGRAHSAMNILQFCSNSSFPEPNKNSPKTATNIEPTVHDEDTAVM